jgi:hypothetical protein
MNFDFVDFTTIKNIQNNEGTNNETINYDKTTTETYRIKRLFKIDPLTDMEITDKLIFSYKYKWNPYTGECTDIDETGQLCFNALSLYDYFFANRFKGLWNPPNDGFQGYYGELVGSGLKLEIKSRGVNPEKYLFRLPIIDCYLEENHNYSQITMGPLLSDEDIEIIDNNFSMYHKNKTKNLTTLRLLKIYYDNALNSSFDLYDFIVFKQNNIKLNLSPTELIYKFNKVYVDKLVNLRY